jgi:hypothetical protein
MLHQSSRGENTTTFRHAVATKMDMGKPLERPQRLLLYLYRNIYRNIARVASPPASVRSSDGSRFHETRE